MSKKKKTAPKVSRRPLNDILKDFMDLESMADPETGELPADKLAELQKELDDKSDAIGYFITMKEKEVESKKIMAETYSMSAKTTENFISSYKALIARAVRNFGSVEINDKSEESMWFRGEVIGIKDTSTDVFKVENENEVPVQYKDMVIRMSFDDWNIVRSRIPTEKIISQKVELNNSKIKDSVIAEKKPVPGVQTKFEYRCTIYGRKNQKDKSSVND